MHPFLAGGNEGGLAPRSALSAVQVLERMLWDPLVFHNTTLESPAFARWWGPSAGSVQVADLVPAENLLSWEVRRLPFVISSLLGHQMAQIFSQVSLEAV